jgi:hypothetical protein
MLLLVIGLNRLVIFIRIADSAPQHSAVQTSGEKTENSEPQPPHISEREVQMLDGTSLIHHSLPLVGGSVIALLLAALFTVLLVFSSRHATLNRINISLAQMAEQLKQSREIEDAPNQRPSDPKS